MTKPLKQHRPDSEPSTLGNVSNALWTLRDGSQIAIKDMTDTHLANAIAMVRRNADEIKAREAYQADTYSDMAHGEQASFELEREAMLIYQMPVDEFLGGYEPYQDLIAEAKRRHEALSSRGGSDE